MIFPVSQCLICGKDAYYSDTMYGFGLCGDHVKDFDFFMNTIKQNIKPQALNNNSNIRLDNAHLELLRKEYLDRAKIKEQNKKQTTAKTLEGKADPIKEFSFKAEDKVYNVPINSITSGPAIYKIYFPAFSKERIDKIQQELFQQQLIDSYRKQINDQINNIVYGASMPKENKPEAKDKCVVEGCDCFEKSGFIVCEEHHKEYTELRTKYPKALIQILLKQMAENLKLKNQQKQATKKKGEGVIMANDLYSERVLKEDTQDAAYRLAARQLTKTVKAPLVAAIARSIDPNDPGLSDKLVAFFGTELGEAFLKGFLSVGVGFVPAKIGDEKVKNLSRELRVSAGAEVGDFLADLLMTPLRSVISDFISTVGTETHKALEQQSVDRIKVEIPIEIPVAVNK